ncbi:MAG: sugar ABC transporter permease, partial [Ignavibacteriales bacterium]|nr:sugar ABC transporter permease [Ignavibacteriales bacterium]
MNKNKLFITFLVLPSFVLLAAVVFYPFLYNVALAFGNMNLNKIRDWQFIGLRQFIKIFTEPSQP